MTANHQDDGVLTSEPATPVLTARGTLEIDDLRAGVRDMLQQHSGPRSIMRKLNRRPFVSVVVFGILGLALAGAASALVGGWEYMPPLLRYLFYAMAVAEGLYALVIVFLLYVTPRSLARQKHMLDEQSYTIVDDGLRLESTHSEGLLKWSGIMTLQCTADHLFVYVSEQVVQIIPRRFFPTNREFEAFAEELGRRYEAAGGCDSDVPTARVVKSKPPVA